MTFRYRYRKQIIIISIILLLLGAIGYYVYYNEKEEKDNKKESILLESTKKKEKKKTPKKEEDKEIMVDVKGEVSNVGIYKLKSGSRVIDQTTTNMIQRIIHLFVRKPLILKKI